MKFLMRISPTDWRSPTVFLFLYGLLKELRPSEPYITVFFTEVKNFTQQEVTETIYPVGTFSTLGLIVLIFLITDALLYRPVIVLQAISCLIVSILLIFGEDYPAILASQFFLGLFSSCDVAYATYLYASVPTEQYPRASMLCRVAYLLGRLLSGLVGQVLVSTQQLNYLELHYISLSTVSLALIVALALPPPKRSLYFHNNSPSDVNASETPKYIQVWHHIKNDLRTAYRQPYVLAWSAWWAVASGVFLQALTYLQVLWLAQTGAEDQSWNGYVEVVYTLLGSVASWLAAHLIFRNSPWKAWAALSVVCLFCGVFLLSSVFTHQIVVEYLLYVLYGALYQSAMTVASSEIAQSISNDSTALIFGMNTFVALVLQSTLTATITSKDGLHLSIHSQFIICASIYGLTAAVFMIMAVVSFFKRPKRNENNEHVEIKMEVSKEKAQHER